MDDCRHMDVGSFRARLHAQRDALVRLMQTRAADEEPEVDKTRSGRLTRMDDLRSQAMSAETERRRKRELARIDSALRRLEEGEFGNCMVCGEAISEGRLGVDPAAECCIRCATQAEQRR